MRKIIVTVILLIISQLAISQNEKPFVIPELYSWEGGTGFFFLSEKTSLFTDEKSREVATTFADDFLKMFSKKIDFSSNSEIKGKISFQLNPEILKEKGEEAYQIEISDQILVKANHRKGLFWATRTLLQLFEQSEKIPQGKIIDYPQYPFRGFMLDVGRKFFTINYLHSVVKLMAYYKMNYFQIHLNDNGFKQYFGDDWQKTHSAFRLESETFPKLTATDGHYTKKEFRELQQVAHNQGVTIIPEIDAPAHTLAFSHFKPELGSEKYGADHLDLFKNETYDFLNALFKEYLEGENPVFMNDLVHIGTDEYSNKDPEVVEKFRYFTDYYIKYVEKFGKKAGLWGALTHASGKTPVKVDDVLMFCWYNPFAQPRDMIALGYDIVSVPDGLIYIVPEAGYYYNYLNINKLYNDWTPAVIGKEVFEENHPKIKGGMFAVWNDHIGNGISEQDVYHRIFPAMQTLSTKMWNGKQISVPFAEFDKKRQFLSEAPAVNRLARAPKNQKGVVFSVKNPKNGEKLNQKITEIGYDYKVSFSLKAGKNEKGTALFSSENAIFYLSDPKNGKIGFSRDGYDYHFNYSVKNAKWLKINILGTNTSTSLFVNGKLVEKLEVIPHPDDKHLEAKKQRKWVQTLVFPLEKLEHFNGKISDLKVEFL